MVSEFTSMPSRREGEIHLRAQPNDLTVSAFELSVSPFSCYTHFTAQPSEILLLPPRMNCLTRRAGKPSQLTRYSDHAKGLDNQGFVVSAPGMEKDFSLLRNAQTGSGSHPPSYLVGPEGCFQRGKAVWA